MQFEKQKKEKLDFLSFFLYFHSTDDGDLLNSLPVDCFLWSYHIQYDKPSSPYLQTYGSQKHRQAGVVYSRQCR
jgi:hypothetical protein